MRDILEKTPKLVDIRSFGDMAVMKIGKKLQSKLENNGMIVMMVGLAKENSRGTYRFLTPLLETLL